MSGSPAMITVAKNDRNKHDRRSSKLNHIVNSRTFTFRYNPPSSVKEMALDTSPDFRRQAPSVTLEINASPGGDNAKSCKLLIAAALITPATPAFADVISDWNEKAVAFLTEKTVPAPQAERTMAMMHVAMFDAVNAIEPRYRCNADGSNPDRSWPLSQPRESE
jgi:hypothetical protein